MNVSKDLMGFLKDLEVNNNRDWFNERKKTFKVHEGDAKNFFQGIQDQLMESDNIEGYKVFRIYRDVRFSKDKTPFKARFAGGFTRATESLRGGYYLNIEPGGKSIAGGGFYSPNPEDLLRIRKEFEMDDTEIRNILNDKTFKDMFSGLQGEEVKTAPKGFSKEDSAIDLIRKKQFYVIRDFSDKEVLSPSFASEVMNTYKAIRPYFDYMSDVLTTDLNGESII